MTATFPTKTGNERERVVPDHSRKRGKPQETAENDAQSRFPVLSFPGTLKVAENLSFPRFCPFPYGGGRLSL